MGSSRQRGGRGSRRQRRVLLVGLTPLMTEVLSGPMSEASEVLAVPFPGEAFEQAADRFGADLILVDITYLDESLVRPLLMQRFAGTRPVLAFVSEKGGAWYDDLATQISGRLDSPDAEQLLALISGPHLSLVEP